MADSRNHCMRVYTEQGVCVGEVRFRPGARRPSELALDKDVYLLNHLQGKWSLVMCLKSELIFVICEDEYCCHISSFR